MARTNIDDNLIAGVMRRYGLTTKKDAVEFALRALSVTPMGTDAMSAMRGVGWGGDLRALHDGEAAELAEQWGRR